MIDSQQAGEPGAVDPAHYREVMGHYPTGVAVVTGTTESGEPVGMVVGTFASVSLDPPLVSFMPKTTSGTFALMRDSGAFCVNVLAHDQLDVCRAMAVPRPGKFDDVAWSASAYGAPALDGAVAHIHCTLDRVVPAGDHLIVLCRVQDMSVTRPATPLLFFQGGYGGFSPGGLAARGDAELIEAVRLADVGRTATERLAREHGCEAALLVAVNDHELTTAVCAFGGSARPQEQLGQRVPLMPPLGEAYIAWAPEATVEAWLRRASSQEPAVVEEYRRRLETVREVGYAMSRIQPEGGPQYGDLTEAMREYAAGELTPARERAVRAVISGASPFYETCEIVDGETYDLGAIVGPVLGPDGSVALCLRLGQLPRGADAHQVRRWTAALAEAAARISRSLETRAGDQYAAWQATTGDYLM
ncbi:flavin reductase [Streptomyces shenzhenensis]|uniref:flavin reductase n=1 Tax=Streptomyces shenzhenensis TaxID=943815 RepID=UPI0015EFE901|nr:flavin reductase [Streptomyces shenzhenensis]